ncbi:transglycosylase domain-containing protein [Sphaerotilus hippei]|uniref:transglycosylase domain-containing protein n=1 Tax=Sphaerotilus hippei TaxID=744406 RepID=UPI0011B41E3E|nr:transglycosylase domain-containing protein [Sphaerotilus hippei]
MRPPSRWPRRLLLWGGAAVVVAGAVELATWEMRTSTLQARFFSDWARGLTWEVRTQPAEGNRYPVAGPFDERRGHHRLPEFTTRLSERGYAVLSQAQQSPALQRYLERGFFAPYPERAQAGLQVRDCRGDTLFESRVPRRVYPSHEDVPLVVAQALGFIENREVLDLAEPRHNPAIEWTRLGKAVLDQFVELVHDDHPAAGGSTLATQIEKFRHSPEGRTSSAGDKYLQMVSASVRAYRDGEDTTQARHRIVLDYLNSLPLGAQKGWGEVLGVSEGLEAWYGADVDAVNRLLREPGEQPEGLQARGVALRQVLSLMIAQRRPAHYFGGGRPQLMQMTASYLRLMADEGLIAPALRDAALQAPLEVRAAFPGRIDEDASARKAATLMRVQLSTLLDTPRLYDLDRMDVSALTSIDGTLQQRITRLLGSLSDPQVAREAGLLNRQLLEQGDPARLLYSFTLYERSQGMNLVRVQTDNLAQPFDINGGAKLELGSTAKLRTLTTYLEIIASLHRQYGGLAPAALAEVEVGPKDRLTQWAIEHLRSAPNRSLQAMLDAAMERKYSASPGETFFTGGGAHTFDNFNRDDNARMPTLSVALRDSVNLVFIRLMRDIVYHHLYQASGPTAQILSDENHPERTVLLRRFADKEGSQFMRNFYRRHHGKGPTEMLAQMAASVTPTASRLAVIHRSVLPGASFEAFSAYLRTHQPRQSLDEEELLTLYQRHAPGKYSLADRGYLARLHPLELWVAAYLVEHPQATMADVLRDGAAEREASYSWLFRSRARAGQNSRILQLLEIEAFAKIHRAWARLGYPFDTLVPSYATSIGSSGDRPAALAELMGIIVNGGLRLPTVHVNGLMFAAGSPYEVVLGRRTGEPERVMVPEVAGTLRRALGLVVNEGTARRLKGSFDEPGLEPLMVGGKTGTGDNRLNTYTRGGGLISSRSTSRTATFVFYIGERHFGTLTAFVLGPEADKYSFTSALPVQILKTMAPFLKPSVAASPTEGCGVGAPTAAQAEAAR